MRREKRVRGRDPDRHGLAMLHMATGLLSIVLLIGGTLWAQDYPTKVIRIITSGIGGGNDFTARQIAQGITGPLGQPVVVDNRGGASGIIAMEIKTQALEEKLFAPLNLTPLDLLREDSFQRSAKAS